MIRYVTRRAVALTPVKIIIIVGHQSEEVKASIGESQKVSFVKQKDLLGTAHAVQQTENSLRGFNGTVLILSGDVPLIREESLRLLLKNHRERGNDLTIMTTILTNPYGYGRIVRDSYGRVIKVIEERDATEEEKKIREINTGIYAVEKEFLFKAIKGVKRENAQSEYYLTDIIEIANKQGKRVSALSVGDPIEVMGINTRRELSDAERYLREKSPTAHREAETAKAHRG